MVNLERVAVFIDNGYFKKVQDSFKIAVDYLKFSEELIGDPNLCTRFRTYVYDCPPHQSNPPTEEQMKLKSGFDSFRYNIARLPRFEFRTGRLQLQRNEDGDVLFKKDGKTPLLRQKGVDMALGIDVARLAATKQIQKVVIVAGDSDFIPAIFAAKQEGALVTLYYTTDSYLHDSLYESCDDRYTITKELLLKCKRERQFR